MKNEGRFSISTDKIRKVTKESEDKSISPAVLKYVQLFFKENDDKIELYLERATDT